MKFFASAEMHVTVADKIRPVRNLIEEKIKSLVENKNYGEGILDWGYIPIVNPKEVYEGGFLKEVKKYTKKEKDLDMRLRIDYEAILNANEKKVYKLICQSILRSIDIAEHELEIKDFHFKTFRKDLTTLFKKEGWV